MASSPCVSRRAAARGAPRGSRGPIIATAAFAEEGKALEIPGPQLRVGRGGPDSQLGGLIIVDSAGVKPNPRERFFAITMWGTLDPTARSGVNANSTFAFNGLSWPRSERFELTQGDSALWRFVNISSFDHPLHLHGFYFRVDAKGDGSRDTLYSADERRMAVTEYVAPFQTVALSWSPDRSGNWIFHCHFAGHIAAAGAFDGEKPVQWHMLSKDGMPSTALQSRPRSAHMIAGSGEIYDLEVVVPAGAVRTFRFGVPDAPPNLFPPTLLTVRGR